MKILIVDDDLGILNGLKAGLISFGYQVLIAKDGYQALQVIKSSINGSEPVTLMLTDLKMPNMNGLELIRSARQVNSELSAILMTAYGNKHVQKEVREMEACEYIDKPFSPQTLQKMIKKILLQNNKERS